MKPVIYLIGSLRNPEIPKIAERIRKLGFEVFDDWHSAGPEADDYFKQYHVQRGIPYDQALKGYAAKHIFNFDKRHLDRADIAVLALPAGRSGHLELGYMIGKGKPGYILFEDGNDRWDLMCQFANDAFFDFTSLEKELLKLNTTSQEKCAECQGSTFQPSLLHTGCFWTRITKSLTLLLGIFRSMGMKFKIALLGTSKT